jgi:elongation factor Ts
MKITTAMVKELRETTGAGVLEAKNALVAAEGNFEVAAEKLREKGAARAEKRSDRVASEGVVEVYSHPGGRVGVILELNCETDFVARNEHFQNLAHDLVLHIAAMSPIYVSAEDVDQATLAQEKEAWRAEALAEGKPANIVDKIVDGRVRKYYEEVCLLEQDFVKDDKVKIKDLITTSISFTGENIIVNRFARYEL